MNGERNPRQENPPGTGVLGIWLMLGSLSMLFAGSLVGYLMVRQKAPSWPPPGSPGLPPGLWASTFVLLAGSWSVHRALRAARSDRQEALRRGLVITLALGFLFLGLQLFNWIGLASANLTARTDLYGFTFYMMTGLHAGHVIGGLIALGIVTRRALRGRYSSFFHPGVRYCAIYWHFLDAVWIVVFAVLLIGS